MEKKSNFDELRPEYDLRKLLKGGVRGINAQRYRAGTYNDALRLDIELTKIPDKKRMVKA